MMDEDGQVLVQELENQLFSKFLLDSAHLMEMIKHMLKGEELTSEPKDYKGQLIEVPMWKSNPSSVKPINELGYHTTVNVLQPLLDKMCSSGNLREDEVNLLIRYNIDSLSLCYAENFDEFGFTSISEMDSLIDRILTLIKMQFSKSINMELVKQLLIRHNINENLTNQKKDQVKEPGFVV